ncbi:adenylate/guanylate cyclase domain-containing protein [Eudoraea sp.]|uniref:adenylate/guanylate cyclase domain-containing protein n=1 Tax=Eudoraea sp. TaxID=1979955 RepID=UPI003C708043
MRRSPGYLKLISVSCLVLFLFVLSCPLKAQETPIAQVEKDYKNLFGLDRLKALNELSAYYQKENSRKATRYGQQAVALSERIFVRSNVTVDFNQRHHQVHAYLLLGEALYNREDYYDAQENFETAKLLSVQINHEAYKNEAELYLEKIQALIESGDIKESFFSSTLGNLGIGEVINNTTNDLTINAEVKLGKAKENSGDFQDAIEHYEKVINLLRNQGDADRIKEFQLKIAVLLDSLNDHVQAQKFLNEAIIDIDANSVKEPLAIQKKESIVTPEMYNIQDVNSPESIRAEQKKLKSLAESYALEEDYETSLAYERMYHELSRKIEADSLNAEMENWRTENEILLLKQQKRIADLNVNEVEKEKERQIKLRNMFVFVALLILLSTLIILYFYRTKKKQHKNLTITHNDLKKTQGKLVDAEKKIVFLLKQQLSGDIAQELLLHNTDDTGKRCFVCIMFLDIRDFTPMAEKLSSEELISYQNKVFGFMIDAVQEFNGNINQLLGDGFMATFGAPVSHGNDCQNAFLAAQKILVELKKRCEAGIVPKTKIGIGLHAGNVVTGNVGNESRKQYSVTGNAVIIASRIEQLNKVYKTRLIITEEVYKHLEEQYMSSESYLEVDVKGITEPIKILKYA